MIRRMPSLLTPSTSLFFIILSLLACGGSANASGGGGLGSAKVAIAVTPASATINAGGTQQYQTTVTGTSNNSVQWQVNGVVGGNAQYGTVSTSGLYRAPGYRTASMQVTVTEVANADTAQTATAQLTVNIISGGPGSVTISPTRAALTRAESQQFAATLSGNENPSVIWSVDGVAGGNTTVGTISTSGLYTAPSTAGTHTVTATSNANPASRASATVWVTNYPGMLTYHADKYRSGVNYQELALSSTTVNQNSFGKLFSVTVDGQLYAQPLYAANLAIGGAIRNVVFVATEHDGVYAFDADGKVTTPLWYRSFVDPSHGITTFPQPSNGLISPEIGITSTPAIDISTKTMYVVAETVEQGAPAHRLHALDLTTGAEKFNGPTQISGSYAGATFNSTHQLQRPALLLLNGVVYICFGSFGDAPPYEGWIFAYSASNGSLQQTGIIGTAPSQGRAALWMSGGGPAADDSGNIYVVTGNGAFDLNSGGQDAGESFLKLNSSLHITDYYTPNNWQDLNSNDYDLGSGGVMLPPTQQGGSAPDLVICGGKDGQVYLVNRDNMGHYDPNQDPAVQKLSLGQPETNGNWFTPAAYQSNIYFGATNDTLRQYTFTNGTLPNTPNSQSSETFAYPGPTPMYSTNGSDGIVWALDNSAYYGGTPSGGVNTSGPAVLHAYRADNLGTELYNSAQNPSRDTAGVAIKFTAPTVANGHVYIGGAGTLTVYGVLP
jgi:hypothetical protein